MFEHRENHHQHGGYDRTYFDYNIKTRKFQEERMKYLILSLVLFVGCSNVYLQDAVEVSTVPVMCKVPGLEGRRYSVTLWTVDSLPKEINSFNLSFLTEEYFIAWVPTEAVDITVQVYPDSSYDYSHYSVSIIRGAVAYDWGEVDKDTAKHTNRGEPVVYAYEDGGDLVYTLKELKPRD